MADAKVEFSMGSLSFAGEGPEAWLAAQLDKVLAAAPSLAQLKIQSPNSVSDAPNGTSGAAVDLQQEFTASLASHIKAKSGETNQNRRFLATADWLRLRGSKALATKMVSEALAQNQQKRLGNPSDCLNNLVGQGLCEKTKDGFFITPEGLKALGHT